MTTRNLAMAAICGSCVVLLLHPAESADTHSSLAGRRVVYSIAEKVTVRSSPRLGDSTANTPTVPFGTKLVIDEENGDWLRVAVAAKDTVGWVHRVLVTDSAALPGEMSRIGAKPSTVILISGIQDSGTFQCSIVEGGIRVGTKRLLAEHGTCVAVRDGDEAVRVGGVSLKGLGVDQTIEDPQSWVLYFYCSNEGKFHAVPSLLAAGKPVTVGEPRPKEEAVVGVAEQKPAKHLPISKRELTGPNPVRVKNPNTFSVKVALRATQGGRDFPVPAGDSSTVYVPDGRYDIYFQYSDDPDGLYQGDAFTLSGNGVEIQIVKVVGGNYGIRKIR